MIVIVNMIPVCKKMKFSLKTFGFGFIIYYVVFAHRLYFTPLKTSLKELKKLFF